MPLPSRGGIFYGDICYNLTYKNSGQYESNLRRQMHDSCGISSIIRIRKRKIINE
jgi:hypothetical protein